MFSRRKTIPGKGAAVVLLQREIPEEAGLHQLQELSRIKVWTICVALARDVYGAEGASVSIQSRWGDRTGLECKDAAMAQGPHGSHTYFHDSVTLASTSMNICDCSRKSPLLCAVVVVVVRAGKGVVPQVVLPGPKLFFFEQGAFVCVLLWKFTQVHTFLRFRCGNSANPRIFAFSLCDFHHSHYIAASISLNPDNQDANIHVTAVCMSLQPENQGANIHVTLTSILCIRRTKTLI